MQTLWTRAAQLGSTCRCPQCASSLHGISRRTTASATRRRPRYLTTSTLLYSGIFAAATTFDAKSKRERREQWDEAIAEIKEELGQPRNAEMQGTGQTDRATQRNPTLPVGFEESLLNEFGSVLDSTHLRRAKHWAPESTVGTVEAIGVAPQSLYASQYRKQRYSTRPWTEKKLERVRLCMDLLQLDIMKELWQADLSEKAAQFVPHSYGQHILLPQETRNDRFVQKLDDVARLRREQGEELNDWRRSDDDIPLNAYEMDEDGHFVAKARDLNQQLQILFRRRAKGKITRAELLAKVSHNMSTCSAPPNVDTFNTLIVGFAHLKEKYLYDRTTMALSHTRVRPNEVTLASIFRYDAESRDHNHFRLWVSRLRGQGGGLYAARKDIVINESNQARLLKRPDSDSEAVIQLPRPTAMVFDALISGLLSFFGFDKTLQVCHEMAHEGWGLSIPGMGHLLRDCAERGDWNSGMAIWGKIQALKAQGRKPFRWGWNPRNLKMVWRTEKIELPTYVAMLKLCRRCEKKDVFKRILKQASEEHHVKLPQMVEMMKENGLKANRPALKVPRQRKETSNHDEALRLGPQKAIASENITLEQLEDTNQMFTLVMRDKFSESVVTQEQLYGTLSGSYQLDEYELSERPMDMTTGRDLGRHTSISALV